MTKYTHNYSLPYPEGNDAVAVHTDIEDLAKRLDATVPAETDRTVNDAIGPILNRVDTHERRISSISPGEETVFRIIDQTGSVALAVDAQGRTHLYDAASGGGSGQRITEWHVFLAAGQSNMSGSGQPFSDALDPEDHRILQYGFNDRSLRPATPQLDMHTTFIKGMSPALPFARHYLQQMAPGIGVLLVPSARSGTAFTDAPDTPTWRPGAASAPEYDLYGLSVAHTLEALDAIGPTGRLKGILWHQGEGNGGMTTEEYVSDLDNLIAHYRDDLDDPDLPFVVGQLAQERMESLPGRRNVDRAHYETPARVVRTGFAPSEWGWASYDETHFGRTGVIGLGRNFVEAYWQAVANADGSQLLPPHSVTTKRVGDQVIVTWKAPTTRVTGYGLRTRPIGGSTWDTVQRESPMRLLETLQAAEPIEIELTAQQGAETSTVVLTQA